MDVRPLHLDENVNNEQLDFEDENGITPSAEPALFESKTCDTSFEDLKDSNYLSSGDDSLSSSSSECEGEMKSNDESDFSNDDKNSEEGEIQSEIDEVEAPVDIDTAKTETPWERGLRLARERLERVKALKAKDKDIVDKRMNLSVPAPVDEKVSTNKLEEEIFWSYYYQVSIIGRTELTSHRYLPEDILPPNESETAEWRRKVSGRGRHNRQRRYSSKSASSSRSSSASSASASSSSNASSLASVATSWKAVCAKAMRDYIGSPRRNHRYGGGSRHSSDSNSQSSGSRSTSRRSSVRQNQRFAYRATGAGAVTERNRDSYWKSGRASGQSRSPSGSAEKVHRFGMRNWGGAGNKRFSNDPLSKYPGATASNRRRSDAPALPNERPVKRPWVADPTLGLADRSNNVDKNDRRGSPSQSPSPLGKDEKHFITSWSRSASSNEDERDSTRRERLPDVIPSSGHFARTRPRAVSSSKRKKSRSPFADDKSTDVSWKPNYGQHYASSASLHHHHHHPHSASSIDANPAEPEPSQLEFKKSTEANVNPLKFGGGELPSNRPGVRLTLASRPKPSLNSLRTATEHRPFQSSPPPSSKSRTLFIPTSSVNEPPSFADSTIQQQPDQTELVRQQAEAAAALLEARDRRRAATKGVNNFQRHRKRHHLEAIPVRGRPTYRRQSFSHSSPGSQSSHSSISRSPSDRGALLMTKPPGSPQLYRGHRMMPSKRGRYDYSDYHHHHHHQQQQQHQRPQQREFNDQAAYRRFGNAMNHAPDQFEFNRHPRNQEGFQRVTNMSRHRGPPDAYGPSGQFNKQMHSTFKRPYHVGPGDMSHSNRGSRFGNNRPMHHPNMDMRRNYGHDRERPFVFRPRTPHGDDSRRPSRRSPHGDMDFVQRAAPSHRHVNYVVDQPQPTETSGDMRRARSRHRSRGPGAVPIDRSEPFESEAAGNYAAEQRLRKLRERLNLVDDAIAEIKAGASSSGGPQMVNFSGSR